MLLKVCEYVTAYSYLYVFHVLLLVSLFCVHENVYKIKLLGKYAKEITFVNICGRLG